MEETECEQLWDKANQKILEYGKDKIKEIFRTVYRLKMNGKYCYKPELFKEKGWCVVAKSSPDASAISPDKQSWGFCSTSCSIKFMKAMNYYSYTIIISSLTFMHVL